MRLSVRAIVLLAVSGVTSVVGSSLLAQPPKAGVLRIATLRHVGDGDLNPQAIPNLAVALRAQLKFPVMIESKELIATAPNLVHYPLVYLHGSAGVEFSARDKAALQLHLRSGGGTLFADAACGSPAFDASFRRFVADLFPDQKLEPILRGDDFFALKAGSDLSRTEQTPAAGGKIGYPELEGVKVDGRWVVIYSKLDLGSALGKQAAIDCRGYTLESAMRITTEIVIYATLP